MAEQIETDDFMFKPGELLSPSDQAFLTSIFLLGICLPLVLCAYGMISYFFLGVR